MLNNSDKKERAIEYVEDGEKISKDIIESENGFNFQANDIKYNEKIPYYNFVGFIIKNDKILAVFPKKFFESNKNLKNESSIALLFRVIKKYIHEKRKGFDN